MNALIEPAQDPDGDSSRAHPHVATSEVLARLLADMPDDGVSLAWLMGRLEQRSFGILMLIAALIGLIPGIATIATIMMPLLAAQMILARPNPTLPRFVAERSLPSRIFSGGISRLIPLFRRMEVFVRPRWRTPFEGTQRAVGILLLVLAVTTLAPFPLYQIPTLVIALVAFAYLEEDGLLLCVSLVPAFLSLAFTAGTILAAIKAAGFIGKLWKML